jgi:hypothetical protein
MPKLKANVSLGLRSGNASLGLKVPFRRRSIKLISRRLY